MKIARTDQRQIRAARALLGWSAADLAKSKLSLGVNTIRRAEIAEDQIALTAANSACFGRP